MSGAGTGNVKVVTRFRPPNSLELREGGDIVVDFDGPPDTDIQTNVKIKGAAAEGGNFTFDKVFPMNTRQQDVFEFGIKETVDGEHIITWEVWARWPNFFE